MSSSAASAGSAPRPPRDRSAPARDETAAATSLSDERARRARATIDELTADRDVFETFFDAARLGLALADLSTRFVRVNETYAELLGRAPEDLIGVPFTDVMAEPEVWRDLLAGRTTSAQAEQEYARPDGEMTWLLHGVAVVRGQDDRPAWFAISAQDITERRRAEQDLRDLTATLTERAVRDPLTGLANRALLEERLRASLARDARSGNATAVLFLDLDGFKAVNDRHGHAVGDDVLRAVARRLVDAVRPSDTVARLGGDEFVVLVESAVEDALGPLADRVRETVGARLALRGLDLTVGVSIGMAVARAGEADPEGLLQQADARMYASKRTRS